MTTPDHTGAAFRARLRAMGWKGGQFRRAAARLARCEQAINPSTMVRWLKGESPVPALAWALLGAFERMTEWQRSFLARRE